MKSRQDIIVENSEGEKRTLKEAIHKKNVMHVVSMISLITNVEFSVVTEDALVVPLETGVQ